MPAPLRKQRKCDRQPRPQFRKRHGGEGLESNGLDRLVTDSLVPILPSAGCHGATAAAALPASLKIVCPSLKTLNALKPNSVPGPRAEVRSFGAKTMADGAPNASVRDLSESAKNAPELAAPDDLPPISMEDFMLGTLALEGAHGSLKTCSDLPLARIRKVMKLEDQAALQVSAETPVLLARAIVMLVMDLTHVGWQVAKSGKRNTLLKGDVSKSVEAVPDFDFLVDVIDGTLQRELQVAEAAVTMDMAGPGASLHAHWHSAAKTFPVAELEIARETSASAGFTAIACASKACARGISPFEKPADNANSVDLDGAMLTSIAFDDGPCRSSSPWTNLNPSNLS